MSTDHTHQNLLAAPGTGPAPTQLPADPAVALLAENGRERFMEIVSAHPSSSLCWALLAEGSLRIGSSEGDVAAYAYARTGYHRGLDALRRAGWKGAGPIPWEHVPNRGFLRALWALAQAAKRIGEAEEYERCAQFLRDSSEAGFAELTQAKEQKSAPVVPERAAVEPAHAEPTPAKPTTAKATPAKAAGAKPAAAAKRPVTRRAPGAKPSSVTKSVTKSAATARQAATAKPTDTAARVKPASAG